ncbi:MAG: 3-hydroxybutyrate oligomer hydrolase family protein [Thermodesulfobacteriota bacterium]
MNNIEAVNTKLDFIMDNTAYKRVCDGKKDDLLSAGFGKFGLKKDAFGKKDQSGNPIGNWEKAPVFDKTSNPAPDELRKRAIYQNYRALVDMSTCHPTAYYGELYGPGVGFGGGEGLISGEEYIALTDDRVTLMVQIPSSFDIDNPCIIAAPSSGSRGIYGAIATVGEWALKRGFAVAYTDKGTGIGVHNLKTDTINLVTGERCKVIDSENKANFIAVSEDHEKRKKILDEFNKKHPDKIAYKHAHSGINPEKDWGKYVLQSIEFAIHILNLKYSNSGKEIPPEFTAENTLVIASSVSNGGGASLRAAEEDNKGLINGIAVSEPNINPRYNDSFAIVQGSSKPFKDHSKNLLDYMTFLNIYAPCACLANRLKNAPMNYWQTVPAFNDLARNRCESLKQKGLLKSEGCEEQANEALKKINEYGLLAEADTLIPSHHLINIYRSICVAYANQYGRFCVTDNLCGYSFEMPQTEENVISPEEARLFCDQTGIFPVPPVNLINENSVGGPMEDRISISPSTNIKDQNLDGALSLYELIDSSNESENSKRVRNGIEEVRASGNLKGLPAIIVTGRADGVIAPNHASRAYFGLNKIVEGQNSNLHYFEITNAHHLDTLNILYSSENHYYTPLHHYFIKALDLMYDHLKNGEPIPESQVIRTNPPAMELPEISKYPEKKDQICLEDGLVKIPE